MRQNFFGFVRNPIGKIIHGSTGWDFKGTIGMAAEQPGIAKIFPQALPEINGIRIQRVKKAILSYVDNAVIQTGTGIFFRIAGQGITETVRTPHNAAGMSATVEIAAREFAGLCFTNLVDFDMLYGHRNDRDGYARALTEFDTWLADFLPQIGKDDLLIITADHGCDPSTPSTDHSREYTPLLMYSPALIPQDLGTRPTFADIAATTLFWLGLPTDTVAGKSLLPL